MGPCYAKWVEDGEISTHKIRIKGVNEFKKDQGIMDS